MQTRRVRLLTADNKQMKDQLSPAWGKRKHETKIISVFRILSGNFATSMLIQPLWQPNSWWYRRSPRQNA
jgi:hypothetical protein